MCSCGGESRIVHDRNGDRVKVCSVCGREKSPTPDSPKTKEMIYLASPYSHKDKDVQNLRAHQVSKMAARLMREGYHIFSPVAHGVQLAQHGLPHGYEEFWKPYCIDMLKRCDRLVVLILRDWHLSVGVMDEIAYAVKNGIPVSFVGLWTKDLDSLKTI